MTASSREEPADWDEQWLKEPFDDSAPEEEARTPRWHAQEQLVLERFGGFDIDVIEIGAGRSTNALLYALRGARATVLDGSTIALEQTRALFASRALDVETVQADVFDLPPDVRDRFDVSMSFGLCEHFLDERRRLVVAAHLQVLKPGGIAMLGVPNRWSPVYRLWVKTLMLRGSWPLGTEVPFSASELRGLARRAGGEPLPATHGSFAASFVDHGINQVLHKLKRRALPVPQWTIPAVDRLGYELLLPVRRPE